MGLQIAIFSTIYVLHFRRLLFHGTPAQVADSPLVRAAYLGSEDLAELAELADLVVEPEPS
jgi:ABC-type lipopolysaccharide export system ATPase subunit